MEIPNPAAHDAPPATPTAADDIKLVSQVICRDRKATAVFISRFSDPVYRYLSSRLAPRMDLVDDLFQEVFLAAWEHLPGYRGGSPLRPWLLGIARHKVEDHYRARLHALQMLPEEELDMIETGPGLDTLFDSGQRAGRIREVLDSLAEPYRIGLLWRYWEQRSAREMAEATGRTEKAVERLLARARQQFRERWRP